MVSSQADFISNSSALASSYRNESGPGPMFNRSCLQITFNSNLDEGDIVFDITLSFCVPAFRAATSLAMKRCWVMC